MPGLDPATGRLLLAIAASTACACASVVEDGASLASRGDRITDPNAMNPNAMNPNAMNPNALSPAALVTGALAPQALTSAAMTALKDPSAAGDLSREFMSYAVGCAFTPDQTFAFDRVNSAGQLVTESYAGLLGLASQWAGAPLDATAQAWVSACLASRVNRYGASVMLSSRGSHAALTTTASERTTYTRIEGAFWGNLFATKPFARACYHAANATHSRSKLRDCAAGKVGSGGALENCGQIEILGDCENHCGKAQTRDKYHPFCGGTTSVVTTFLE